MLGLQSMKQKGIKEKQVENGVIFDQESQWFVFNVSFEVATTLHFLRKFNK